MKRKPPDIARLLVVHLIGAAIAYGVALFMFALATGSTDPPLTSAQIAGALGTGTVVAVILTIVGTASVRVPRTPRALRINTWWKICLWDGCVWFGTLVGFVAGSG
jgi:hypothetical protein